MSINPDFADGVWDEPSDDANDFYEQMGATPEEAASASYENMLAGFGLEPADIREMAETDGVVKESDEFEGDSGIVFDASRSPEGSAAEAEFLQTEHDKPVTKPVRRLQAGHNEPVVTRMTRHIPDKPDFTKSDDGSQYDLQ